VAAAHPVTVTGNPELEVPEDEAASSRISPNLIKKLRKKLNLTQAELATLVGVTPGAVAFWEQGRSRPRESYKRALVSLRHLGRRDVAAMLAGGANDGPSPLRGSKKKRVRMGRPRKKATRAMPSAKMPATKKKKTARKKTARKGATGAGEKS
jgi:DNA-binding transcriptional regulator YiaG